jgi:hypothetical protein
LPLVWISQACARSGRPRKRVVAELVANEFACAIVRLDRLAASKFKECSSRRFGPRSIKLTMKLVEAAHEMVSQTRAICAPVLQRNERLPPLFFKMKFNPFSQPMAPASIAGRAASQFRRDLRIINIDFLI